MRPPIIRQTQRFRQINLHIVKAHLRIVSTLFKDMTSLGYPALFIIWLPP